MVLGSEKRCCYLWVLLSTTLKNILDIVEVLLKFKLYYSADNQTWTLEFKIVQSQCFLKTKESQVVLQITDQ